VLLFAAQRTRKEEFAISLRAGSLKIRREALVDPFSACAAFSENSLRNGTDFYLGFSPTSVNRLNNNSTYECTIQSRGQRTGEILFGFCNV
jgi:hypothetical protein